MPSCWCEGLRLMASTEHKSIDLAKCDGRGSWIPAPRCPLRSLIRVAEVMLWRDWCQVGVSRLLARAWRWRPHGIKLQAPHRHCHVQSCGARVSAPGLPARLHQCQQGPARPSSTLLRLQRARRGIQNPPARSRDPGCRYSTARGIEVASHDPHSSDLGAINPGQAPPLIPIDFTRPSDYHSIPPFTESAMMG